MDKLFEASKIQQFTPIYRFEVKMISRIINLPVLFFKNITVTS